MGLEVIKANIDADGFLYEIGWLKNEKTGNPIGIRSARKLIQYKINTIMEGSGADIYQLYLSGKDNFRLKIATILEYKGKRLGKPPIYEELKKIMIEEYDAFVVHGMEADDWVAIKQTPYTILCSRDKDLNMVEGWHYSWGVGKQKEKGKWFITPEEGIRFFYVQLMTGDKQVDNIPGLDGIGPVKANKALDEAGAVTEMEMYDVCLAGYEKQYGTEEFSYESWEGVNLLGTAESMLIENGRLLWMKRSEQEYLWVPPAEEEYE